MPSRLRASQVSRTPPQARAASQVASTTLGDAVSWSQTLGIHSRVQNEHEPLLNHAMARPVVGTCVNRAFNRLGHTRRINLALADGKLHEHRCHRRRNAHADRGDRKYCAWPARRRGDAHDASASAVRRRSVPYLPHSGRRIRDQAVMFKPSNVAHCARSIHAIEEFHHAN